MYCICSFFIKISAIPITLRDVAQLLAHSFHPYFAEGRAIDDMLVAGYRLFGDGVYDPITNFFAFNIDAEVGLVFLKFFW